MVRDSERFGHTRLCEDVFERQELDTLRVSLDWGGNFGTEHEQVATTVHEQVVWAYGFKPADTLAALLQPTVRPAWAERKPHQCPQFSVQTPWPAS